MKIEARDLKKGMVILSPTADGKVEELTVRHFYEYDYLVDIGLEGRPSLKGINRLKVFDVKE